MKNSYLLFYGQSETSLKKIIIDFLSLKGPCTVSEIYVPIKKDLKIKVSYQAVHKAMKQLHQRSVLVLKQKKYCVNEEWVRETSRALAQIELRCQGEFQVSKNLSNQEQGTFNVILAKDGILRNKLQEQALVNYIQEWIPILREELKPHNIFQKSREEILQYLLRIQKEHELFIALINRKVVGGTVLEKKDENITGDHKVWKLKHFALNKEITGEVEKEILTEIEEILCKKSKSVKIQLNLSEKESRYIELFQNYGFKKEGTLEDHYRVGEKMVIYSKLVKS